jgi:antirestriction protein ArdC
MPKRKRKPLTDEERAEKRAAERKLMAAAVDSLRSSDGWQRWLRVRRHFRTYSFANQLLIAWQMPEATRVAGFRKWLALGYAVRKGERGISIWAPCTPSKAKLEKWRKEGADRKTRPKTFFRMVKVFDRSQVDPLPNFPGGGVVELDPPLEPIEGDGLAGFLAPLERFAASIGYAFSIEPTPAGVNGFCSPKELKVVVRPVSEDYSPNAQVRTAVHEDSHALVRAERDDDDPKLSYAEEEVVVECVACSVCSSLGLDTSGYSVTYMASWGDGTEIERYGELIDRLASRIEAAVLLGDAAVDQPQELLAAAA